MPVFGLGTWGMGEHPGHFDTEVNALRAGLDLGVRLVDTAEMYGEGGAEKVVGKALAGRREQVYLVSKVYPHNAGRRDLLAACERSLRRLGTDYLDLYLLHWRGSVPLEETFEGFRALLDGGKARACGVSNFDQPDLDRLSGLGLDRGPAMRCNQVLYNLARREAEWSVADWCRQRQVALMAYCPLDQGALLVHPALVEIAGAHAATPAQVALAWLLSRPGVVVIPKSADPARISENVGAVGLTLSAEALERLERAFPAPARPARLGIV